MSDQQPGIPPVSAPTAPPTTSNTISTSAEQISTGTSGHHPAPSLPTSPLAKRFKMDDGSSSSGGAGNATTATATRTNNNNSNSNSNSSINSSGDPYKNSDGSPSLPSVASILNHEPAVSSIQSMHPPPHPLDNHQQQHLRGGLQPQAVPLEANIPVSPLQIKKLSPKARAPTRGSAFAAGYDLYSAEEATIPARGQTMLSTGIAIAVPKGTYGRVAPRSGLAVKHSIATGAGVIDYDYRGEVKLLLFNHSDTDFQVKEGDRMAQLVLERIVTPEVMEVTELPESIRGVGGFGSTGGFGTGAVATAVAAAQGTLNPA